MATIALLLDEDVRPLLGEILRQRGYDVVHVIEVGRAGKTDADQLAYSASQRRTVLSHNIRDFRQLNRQYHEESREHFGILLSDQVPLRDLPLRRTLRFLSVHKAEEVRNNILWLNE
jgi:predicted nuclease of predicted toxin-antitoxin system